MFSACKGTAGVSALLLVVVAAAGAPRAAQPLRVCADPNNLPFSNERGEGFENRLAEMLGRHLHRVVTYTWWPQRRGFIRNTLSAGKCDVVMGVPAEYELVRTTQPYYRSTYVFVTRRGTRHIDSLDDPMLRRLRIGLHTIGDDYANVPPMQALANRGIIANIHGYSIYGDYSQPNPPAALIAAVAHNEIDVAIAWGPLGGYFATREERPLMVTPLARGREGVLRFAYDIAMGVRRGDEDLRSTLNMFITRQRRAIAALLREYGVPLVARRQESWRGSTSGS
jgi:quinoprotein dehydrogenase-associated probable ABC transporter substrate-binding protein